jgi:hypothetical protein
MVAPKKLQHQTVFLELILGINFTFSNATAADQLSTEAVAAALQLTARRRRRLRCRQGCMQLLPMQREG